MSFLAQATSVVEQHPLLYSYGPLGFMCSWFMWRGEKVISEIRTLSHRIDGITKAMLVDVLSRESCGPAARKAAKDMLDKVESPRRSRAPRGPFAPDDGSGLTQ